MNVSNELQTNSGYTIVAYCSENYSDAHDFSIRSWLTSAADRILVYTDFDLEPVDTRVIPIKHFSRSTDWLENVGRKAVAAEHAISMHPERNIVFLDCDCYLCKDVGSVFLEPFDVAATRLFSSESYAANTANCGVWFAKGNSRAIDFVRSWCALSGMYRSAGKGVQVGWIAYDQYAFTDLLRGYLADGTIRVLPLDERVFNCEHDDLERWKEIVAKFKPRIIHFKGRRYRNTECVSEMLNIAEGCRH